MCASLCVRALCAIVVWKLLGLRARTHLRSALELVIISSETTAAAAAAATAMSFPNCIHAYVRVRVSALCIWRVHIAHTATTHADWLRQIEKGTQRERGSEREKQNQNNNAIGDVDNVHAELFIVYMPKMILIIIIMENRKHNSKNNSTSSTQKTENLFP